MNTSVNRLRVAGAKPKIAVNKLQRTLGWTDVFWIASGVPALVLFTVGEIGAQVGTPAFMIWTISVLMGFSQAFTYAEISGLFPNKSGGASVYGSVAWLPYSKFVAPLSTWCNWFAWTPILAIGTGLMAGYIQTSFLPATSPLLTWQLTLLDLGWISEGLCLRLNFTFFLAAFILIGIFMIQHYGMSKAAKVTMVLSIAGLIPLLMVTIVPLVTGQVHVANFTPFVPISGAFDKTGIGVLLGGLFVAAWSTYAFETCVRSEERRVGKECTSCG